MPDDDGPEDIEPDPDHDGVIIRTTKKKRRKRKVCKGKVCKRKVSKREMCKRKVRKVSGSKAGIVYCENIYLLDIWF